MYLALKSTKTMLGFQIFETSHHKFNSIDPEYWNITQCKVTTEKKTKKAGRKKKARNQNSAVRMKSLSCPLPFSAAQHINKSYKRYSSKMTCNIR